VTVPTLITSDIEDVQPACRVLAALEGRASVSPKLAKTVASTGVHQRGAPRSAFLGVAALMLLAAGAACYWLFVDEDVSSPPAHVAVAERVVEADPPYFSSIAAPASVAPLEAEEPTLQRVTNEVAAAVIEEWVAAGQASLVEEQMQPRNPLELLTQSASTPQSKSAERASAKPASSPNQARSTQARPTQARPASGRAAIPSKAAGRTSTPNLAKGNKSGAQRDAAILSEIMAMDVPSRELTSVPATNQVDVHPPPPLDPVGVRLDECSQRGIFQRYTCQIQVCSTSSWEHPRCEAMREEAQRLKP